MRQLPASTQAPGRAHRHRYETPFWRRIMLAGIRFLPQPIQRASMPIWAGIFYLLVPSARRAVEANLRQVRGGSRGLRNRFDTFRLLVNYAQSLTNMYALYLGQPLPVVPVLHGRDKMVRLREQRNGIIFVTGHIGFWSLAPFVMEQAGLQPPVMAMAGEPNARLQEFEEHLRKRWRIVYTTNSPFSYLELANVLRAGESVAMQLDRYLGGPHISVPFLGRPAVFPTAPALLSRVTGAPILPVFLVREGARGFHAMVEDPIVIERTADRDGDARRATARVISVYESYVRRYPLQWFHFHDFWQAPPPPPSAQRPRGRLSGGG